MRRLSRAILSLVAHGSKQLAGLFTLPTVAALVGTVLSVWGLFLVYAPLAFIVPGAALVGFGVWLAPASLRRQFPRGDE